MNPLFYQLSHPCHWLTYGNNATAVAGISTIAGLAGLFMYVRYTKSIMDATLTTLEASIYPVLFAHSQDQSQHHVHWKISNIGRGVARNVAIWRIEEGNEVASLFKKRQELPMNERAIIYGTLRPDHDPSAAFEVRYPYATGEDAFLVVVDAEDNAGNAHQLQILSFGKESSKGHLVWYNHTLTISRKQLERNRRKPTKVFVHGKGTQVGVDLNLYEIDGTPYKNKNR